MARKRAVASRSTPATVPPSGQVGRWPLYVGVGLDAISGMLDAFYGPLSPLAFPARLMVNVTEPKSAVCAVDAP